MKITYKEKVIADIKKQLDNIDNLTKEDFENINKVLEAFIEEKEV